MKSEAKNKNGIKCILNNFKWINITWNVINITMCLLIIRWKKNSYYIIYLGKLKFNLFLHALISSSRLNPSTSIGFGKCILYSSDTSNTVSVFGKTKEFSEAASWQNKSRLFSSACFNYFAN